MKVIRTILIERCTNRDTFKRCLEILKRKRIK